MGLRGHTTLWAWVLGTVLVVGVGGFLLGRQGRSDAFVTGPGIAVDTASGGTAYIGADEPLKRAPYGFAYSLPANVTWADTSGEVHDGGRPPCLAYGHGVRVRNMEAVQFPLPGGGYTGTILWVQC
jgi:hypothetical protein